VVVVSHLAQLVDLRSHLDEVFFVSSDEEVVAAPGEDFGGGVAAGEEEWERGVAAKKGKSACLRDKERRSGAEVWRERVREWENMWSKREGWRGERRKAAEKETGSAPNVLLRKLLALLIFERKVQREELEEDGGQQQKRTTGRKRRTSVLAASALSSFLTSFFPSAWRWSMMP
jgi:hypothetical protein